MYGCMVVPKGATLLHFVSQNILYRELTASIMISKENYTKELQQNYFLVINKD
jgi:hypothetical protein